MAYPLTSNNQSNSGEQPKQTVNIYGAQISTDEWNKVQSDPDANLKMYSRLQNEGYIRNDLSLDKFRKQTMPENLYYEARRTDLENGSKQRKTYEAEREIKRKEYNAYIEQLKNKPRGTGDPRDEQNNNVT